MEDKTQRLEPAELEENNRNNVPDENTASQEVKDTEAKPKLTKSRKIAIAVAAGVMIIAIAAGIAYAVVSSQHEATTLPAKDEAPVETNQPAENHPVSVKVTCDGWNADTSTPIVVSVYKDDVKDTLLSTDENVTAPDPLLTREVNAGEATSLDDITEAGTYTIAITGSPVLEDGTIFDLPEPQVVDFDGINGAEVDLTLTAKAADQVTEADIAAAQATAAAAGADTAKVTNNASKANEKAASAQGGTVAAGTANAVTKSNASKTGTTVPSQPTQSNSSSSQPSSGGNSGNNGSTQPSAPSQPAHQHSWVPITKTVHHDAQTVTHPAEYSTFDVYVCVCGAEFSTASALSEHSKSYRLNGISGHGSGGTKEKKVQTKAAWTETVKAAYDETVTTGYRCSSCGATK